MLSLAVYELAVTDYVGQRRYDSAIARGWSDKLGRNQLSSHIRGARCECAFGKFLNRYWPMSVDTPGEPDFPPNIDVKGSDPFAAMKYGLKCGKSPHPDWKYVLVIDESPNFWVPGWVLGSEVTTRGRLLNPHGDGESWFVEIEKLRKFKDSDRNGGGQ